MECPLGGCVEKKQHFGFAIQLDNYALLTATTKLISSTSFMDPVVIL